MKRLMRWSFLTLVFVVIMAFCSPMAHAERRGDHGSRHRGTRIERHSTRGHSHGQYRGSRQLHRRHDYRRYHHQYYRNGGRHRFPYRYYGHGRYFTHWFHGRPVGPHSRFWVRYHGHGINVYWPYYYEPTCGEWVNVPTMREFDEAGGEYIYDEWVYVRWPCYY